MGLLAINGEVVSEAMRVDELPRGRREEGASIAGLEVWQPWNQGLLPPSNPGRPSSTLAPFSS